MRRGFTVIELVVAIALSAIVVMSAMSVMFFLTSSEERLATRFDDQEELIVTQTVVRRAMGSLIASKPKDPDPRGAVSKDREAGEEGGMEAEGEAQADELTDLIASVTGDEALAASLMAGAEADRPNFELYFDEMDGMVLPALEVKVMESPVPPPSDAWEASEVLGVEQFLPVRGVFETLVLEDGLALQWRPISPPAAPTLLIRGLAAIEWYCLPHKEDWVDVYAAYLQRSFPAGVRLVMWTNNGTHVDWFFDTATTTPEGL